MEIEPQRSESNSEPKPVLSLSIRLIAGVILLAFGSGMVGGIFGFWYTTKNPDLVKFLNLSGGIYNNSTNITVNEESGVINVVRSSAPAVVSIVISKDVSKERYYSNDPFSFFFGGQTTPNAAEPDIQEVGAGTGFFISENGLILTNKHVVSDSSAQYRVITNDGKNLDAIVLSKDPVNDLALIKVEIKDAKFLELSVVSAPELGQRVVAIGNSLGQYKNTVTTGVVSGLGRSIVAGGEDGTEMLDGVIQTDAAINPGNSGGPLLNMAGQVIGINTAIDRQGQLVGFAIPANDAKRAVDSYKKNGKITRPYLGVRYVMINASLASEDILPKDHGALVVRGATPRDYAVIPGGPADKAGLVENDIILAVNGEELSEELSLSGALRKFNAGDNVELKVFSKGGEKKVRVLLEETK